jgi:hypothetical protein
MVAHRIAAALWALLAPSSFLPLAGTAETKPARRQPTVVSLPQGPVTRIPSADRRWMLVFEFPASDKSHSADCRTGENETRKLWIKRKGSRERTLVRDFDRRLDISWSPDSHHFFVNDASGSTDTLGYVYDPVTLKATALADVVTSADPDAMKDLGAGHSYLEANRWINSHELSVTLWGHFDEERVDFKIRYRVDLNGRVERLSKREYR